MIIYFAYRLKTLVPFKYAVRKAITVKYKHTYKWTHLLLYHRSTTYVFIIIIANIKTYTEHYYALLYTGYYWTITGRMLSTRSTVHVWSHLKGSDVLSNKFIHYGDNENIDNVLYIFIHHNLFQRSLQMFIGHSYGSLFPPG